MKQYLILPFIVTLAGCGLANDDKPVANGRDIIVGSWLTGPSMNKADTLFILSRKSERDIYLLNMVEYKFKADGSFKITSHAECGTGQWFYSNCRWECNESTLSTHEEAGRLVGGEMQTCEVDSKYQIVVLDSTRIQLNTIKRTVHNIKQTDNRATPPQG